MKNIILSSILALVIAFNANAQSKDPWFGTAKKTTKQLKEKLLLSEAQEKSVFDITYDFHKQAPSLKKDKGLRDAAREKYVKKVNKALTVDQKKKWLEIRSKDEFTDYDEK